MNDRDKKVIAALQVDDESHEYPSLTMLASMAAPDIRQLLDERDERLDAYRRAVQGALRAITQDEESALAILDAITQEEERK